MMPVEVKKPDSAIVAEDEPPPFFGSWRCVYLAVVVYVLALVFLLFWMTVALND